MGKSLAQMVAELGEAEREKVLADLDMNELLFDWSFWGRDEQKAPEGGWALWLIIAGRGFGKSRSGSEWIREQARYSGKGQLRFGLVARTSADVRDVIVEGESGIMNISPPSERPEYQPSKRKLTWPNGNTALCATADEPDMLRGVQFHHAWGDEIATWRQIPDSSGLSAFDNLRIATRLGENPRIIVTTTPKRVPVMRTLLTESVEHPDRVVVTRGSTMDNAGNLSKTYLDGIYGIYGGTRLARQELSGEMLDDVEGALWSELLIDAARVAGCPVGLPIRVVGVDPSVAEKPKDECGIVVVLASGEQTTFKREAYVVEDRSVLGSPEVWTKEVARTARKWGAMVIVEVNQGGQLVKDALRAVDPGLKILTVHSKWGKALRAEPAVLAYEQGRVHHVGVLADLESQMLSWVPGEGGSPDRVDALVHALWAAMVEPPAGLGGGGLVAKTVAGRKMSGANRATEISRVGGGRRGGRVVWRRPGG